MKISKNLLIKFILIFIIYILSFQLINFLLKETQRKFSINSIYFIPSLILFTAIFIFLERTKLKKLKLRINTKETLIFLPLYTLTLFIYVYLTFLAPEGFVKKYLILVIMVSYASLLLALFFLILSILNIEFIKKFKRKLLASVIITLLFFEFTLILRENWRFLSTVIGKITYPLLILSGKSPTLKGIELSIENFSITLGAPCSGIESISLFTAILLLVIIFDYPKINKTKLITAIPLGYIGIFAMLILRIYSLMLIGTINPNIAINTFHTHIGWIIFSAYTLLYFYFAYPYIQK